VGEGPNRSLPSRVANSSSGEVYKVNKKCIELESLGIHKENNYITTSSYKRTWGTRPDPDTFGDGARVADPYNTQGYLDLDQF
jgi:hypothetical protein